MTGGVTLLKYRNIDYYVKQQLKEAKRNRLIERGEIKQVSQTSREKI